MNQTFVCCSTYHVYISILEAYKNKKQNNESILLLFDDNIEGMDEFSQRVNQIGVFKKVILINGYQLIKNLKKESTLVNYLFNRASEVVLSFEKKNPNLLPNLEFIKNSEINLFQLNRTRAYFLIKFKDNFFRMYEDGYGTYTQKLPIIRYFTRKYITRFPLLKGHDKQVKEVYVNYPDKIKDKILIPKLKKLDLKKLEEQLTENESDKIVFSLIGNLNIENKIASSLIITQPLSEDKICSEKIKIQLYQEIVNKEIKNGNFVFVKMHPREKTVYNFENKNVFLLPRLFPLEVFNLSKKYTVEKGISFYSTALYNLTNTNDKVMLGEDYLKKRINSLS